MQFKNKPAVLAALILAGCASAPYVPPTDGPTSTIDFVNQATSAATILFYEDGLACRQLHRLSFYSTNFRGGSVVFPSDKPFTFTIDRHSGRAYCRQTYMFTPGEFNYRISSTSNENSCGILVEKTSKNSATPTWSVVKDLVERDYRTPWLESGEWCWPL